MTKVVDAKTDPKMYQNSLRTSETGILNGALSPNPPGSKLGATAATGDILATTVVGALFGDAIPPLPRLPNPKAGVWLAINKDIASLFADNEKLPSLISLLEPSVRDNVRTHIEARVANMYKMPGEPNAYESRVLHGIWATAPYLHNGSVPNLYELLAIAGQAFALLHGRQSQIRSGQGRLCDDGVALQGRHAGGRQRRSAGQQQRRT